MQIRLFILGVLFSVSGNAQDSIFTAKDAVDIALKQNLDIQIAQSDVEITKINNTWANAGMLPTITAQATNTEAISNLNQKLNNGNSIQRSNVKNNSLNANITW